MNNEERKVLGDLVSAAKELRRNHVASGTCDLALSRNIARAESLISAQASGGTAGGEVVRQFRKLYGDTNFTEWDNVHFQHWDFYRLNSEYETRELVVRGSLPADPWETGELGRSMEHAEVASVKPDGPNADAIITSLYRRFKDWSARGFGADDVTWCEVKDEVMQLIKNQSLTVPTEVMSAMESIVSESNSHCAYLAPQARTVRDWLIALSAPSSGANRAIVEAKGGRDGN